MGFWCSLFVEIIGGLVTALALGVGAATFAASQQVRNQDDRVDDLYEDNRRWQRKCSYATRGAFTRERFDFAAGQHHSGFTLIACHLTAHSTR